MHALQEQREWLASQGGTGSNGDNLYAALDASTISVSACSGQQTVYVLGMYLSDVTTYVHIRIYIRCHNSDVYLGMSLVEFLHSSNV